jgi:hypothetical protein
MTSLLLRVMSTLTWDELPLDRSYLKAFRELVRRIVVILAVSLAAGGLTGTAHVLFHSLHG